MEVSDDLIRTCTRRLMLARMRLLCNNAFYGLLLMHVRMGLSDEYETAWTEEGEKLVYNPEFLKGLSDAELDYTMMHLVMHLALAHTERSKGHDKETFDAAADVVVNSNILRSSGGSERSITLSSYGGVQPHKAPDGSEGYTHSVDEIYALLMKIPYEEKDEEEDDENKAGMQACAGGGDDRHGTDSEASGDGEGEDGDEASGDANGGKGRGQGGDSRQGGPKDRSGAGKNRKKGMSGWDRHVEGDGDSAEEKDREWKSYMIQAVKAVAAQKVFASSNMRGTIPAFAERFLEELKKPQTDWRTILNEFIQEDITDYSFTPPDRRFDDSPFFLPDFNEKDERVEKILFMIDTSASMSDAAITTVYSEIKGAVDQFAGRLEGWLGFFDAAVIPPKPFEDEDELLVIKPEGGGGTDFRPIFKYVRDEMIEDPPVSIVILTDGYAPFPHEKAAMGIPVLWIVTNKEVNPPFGKTARVKVPGE